MIWQPGRTLQGNKYTIRQVLGAGHLSVTYLAETLSGQWKVIKTPNDEAMQRSDFERLQQVFVQEATKLARCRHPHIVNAGDPFLEDGIWCIPMDYIAGTTLDRRDRPILPETEAVTYIRQIGEALAAVHKNNLLHRDVTPANMMLRIQNGISEAVLIDFGLAREFDHTLTQTRTEEITPGYTPLELYSRQGDRGAFTDIYALGATLYNLLTGKVPPSAEDRKLRNAELPFPDGISRQLKQAIEWAMKLEPTERPQSVSDWLEALPRSGQPSVTTSSLGAEAQPARINWTVVWAAVAAIGTLLAGLAGIAALIDAFQPNSPPSPPTQPQTP